MSELIKIQIRRGSSTDWSISDPVLARGEFGLDETGKFLRIGDGITQWSELNDLVVHEELHAFSLLG